MLDRAFDWLDFPSRTLNLSNESVTADLCLINKHSATEQLSLDRKHYVGLKYEKNPVSEELTQAHMVLLRSERYLKFLGKCETHLQHENTQSIYQLLLNVVAMDPQTQQHTATVLNAWLNQDQNSALQFYEQWLASRLQATGSETNDEMLIVSTGTVCTHYFLKHLQASLHHQADPLALCRLSTVFIDSPIQFAACIIWILDQGGSVDGVLQSRILHQFLSYYFPNFGIFEKPLNTVSLFYKVLAQFPNATLLIERASLISSDMRGFKRINLLGNQSSNLISVENVSEQPLLTRTSDNLKQIINVFGERGTFHAIKELFQHSDNAFDHFFKQFVQENNGLITPTLLQWMAEESFDTLKKLAYLIDDTLFKQWLSEGKYTILYLLPYKPQWIQSIDQEMMQSFLLSIDPTQTLGGELENTKLLMSLYEATLMTKASLAELVYQSLFQMVLTHRYLLDDRPLFTTLRQSSFLPPLVETEAVGLIDELTQHINAFILNEDRSIEEYSNLSRHWQMLVERFEIFMLFTKIPHSFPMKRGDFIVSIFKQCILMNCNPWSSLLDITQVISSSESTIDGYQRDILLKLLAHIDHHELREIIISTLALTDSFFLEMGRDVLLNGVAKGNIGLLDKYLSHHPLDNELLQQAIVSHQWLIIAHWLNQYGFADQEQETIDLLLIEVSGSKNLNLLRRLIKGSDFNFSANSVAKAFAKAASVDDPAALNYLYLLNPYPMTLKAVVTQTISDGHYNTLKFFKRFKKHNEHLANGVLQGFNNALIKNDTHMVASLMEFSSNAPSQQNIQAAKNRIEEKEKRFTKKAKNKSKAVDSVDRSSTKEMLQLLTQLQNPTPPIPSKEGEQKRIKLPPAKSFYSTDSLTRAGSSIFGSPLYPVGLEWRTERSEATQSSVL